jgi:predicted N-acetyltransferase YhbS
MAELTLDVRRERSGDSDAIEKLHERAFGPGRFARTAFRLREGLEPVGALCFTAHVGTLLVGSIQLWPIRCGAVPSLLLGPLAVDPAFAGRGIGLALMRASLDAARAGGESLVILVGDEPYYARVGFRPVPPGLLKMPGPVDPRRLLHLELAEGALARAAGPVTGDASPERVD